MDRKDANKDKRTQTESNHFTVLYLKIPATRDHDEQKDLDTLQLGTVGNKSV